jgi:hypothetical protein
VRLPEKQLKQKRSGGMVQVIEYLPSKRETLSSNPGSVKEGEKKAQAPITRYHRLGGLSNRDLFSHCSGAWKS